MPMDALTVISVAACRDGNGERVGHSLRSLGRVLGALDLGQHDDEFVAAEPGDGSDFFLFRDEMRCIVTAPHAIDQSCADLAEEDIAGIMSKRVIYTLEVIQVEKQDGQDAL